MPPETPNPAAPGPGSRAGDVLVCFAVAREAGPRARASGARILVTGMGQRNAEASLTRALLAAKPAAVFTCGFAGGLHPALRPGDIVFDHDSELNLTAPLLELGARPARFRLAQEVVAKAEEKALLHALTGADAIEMESVALRALCRKAGIPSATIRVILDAATEDLPVDFNRLMTRRMRLSYLRLAWLILQRPGVIAGLRKLQTASAEAARRLDAVLARLLAPPR